MGQDHDRSRPADALALARENQRLLAQVEIFAGDDWIRREAAPWRDATPEERVAETFRLCALVPWSRAHLGEDARARAATPPPLPEDTRAILAALKSQSGEPA